MNPPTLLRIRGVRIRMANKRRAEQNQAAERLNVAIPALIELASFAVEIPPHPYHLRGYEYPEPPRMRHAVQQHQQQQQQQLDPEQSAIVQAYCMSSAQFDRIKDAVVKPSLNPGQSLRLFPRGFFWDIAEDNTYAAWWLPLVTWLPLALYFACIKFEQAWQSGIMLVSWLFLWPLIEYGLHRFLFHSPVAWTARLPHFVQGTWNVVRLLLHTVHHAHPTDRRRIVTPLIMSALLAVLVLGPLAATLPERVALPLALGLILGYVQYDLTHHALHAWHSVLPLWMPNRVARWWAALHKAHANHHYATRGAQESFDVAHGCLDSLFGTAPRP